MNYHPILALSNREKVRYGLANNALFTYVGIASFLRLLPKFSYQQKSLVYEQLMKSGFRVEVAA